MEEKQLSAVETELYDRQIRLWGIESQEKLRAANVLLIGVRGLGSEIAKNILLSGINSLTILDEGTVTEQDLKCNFLLNKDSVIGNKIVQEVLLKAQSLNPLVKLIADAEAVSSKPAVFFESFTIIVATGIKVDDILRIDEICRASSHIKFIYGDVFGMFGYSVADFLTHDYFEDVLHWTGKKRSHDGTEKTTIKVKRNIDYPALCKVFGLNNDQLNLFKKSKRVNNLYLFMLVLVEFRKEHGRNPDITKKADDIKAIKSITSKVADFYKVTNLKLDDLYDLIFGEVVPVCAILGGVIAQEVIKAVSQKEVPINNTFLFDPVTYSGTELSVGA